MRAAAVRVRQAAEAVCVRATSRAGRAARKAKGWNGWLELKP